GGRPGRGGGGRRAALYAHRTDAPNGEDGVLGGAEPDAPASWRFSTLVATAWERALDDAKTPATRKLKMRSALTLSPDRGGIFEVLLRLVRFGLRGSAAGGRQVGSWIHHHGFVGAVWWLIAHEEIDGGVNIAAPEPVPNAAFMRGLREAWGTPIGLPATRWMLELGALVLRTETELVLKSRRV